MRTIGDAPLPGKALVVLDPVLKLATHVFPCEDGHAQERSLLSHVLPCVEKDDLWIADRNFCTLGFLFGIKSNGGKFLIREHANLPGRLRGKPKYIGRIPTGRVYEQSMDITDPVTGKIMTVRRITIKLNQATRDGDLEMHIVTNLPKRAADAKKVASIYQKRWTIETMFQELTETLTCEIKTLGYPKAAVFAFCLALVAYNGISVIKAALRSVHGTETVEERVSGYYLSLEISKTYTGMMIAIPAEHWIVFRSITVTQLAQVLRELASQVDLSKYQKHRRGPKQPRRNEFAQDVPIMYRPHGFSPSERPPTDTFTGLPCYPYPSVSRVFIIAHLLQSELIATHMGKGGIVASHGLPLELVYFVCLWCLAAYLASSSFRTLYGTVLEFGNDEVYYSGDATAVTQRSWLVFCAIPIFRCRWSICLA